MLAHFWFDFAMTFYALCGAGLTRYLWICRTPIDASIHRLQVPKVDNVEWHLNSGSDVGMV
jgi:hypothetical protein